MVYQYVAYNEKELIKGKLEAASEDAASELLSNAGFQVLSLKFRAQAFSLDKVFPSLFKAQPSEIVLFYRELALLLESGVDIVTSLELLQTHMSNRVLRKVCGEVIGELRNGNQLSEALAKHPDVFSTMYCRLLGVGERSGGLETILRQMADYMEKDVATKKEVKGALTYPMITMVVAVGVVGVLVTFVLPAFSKLYMSMGVQLPLITRIVLGSGDFFQKYGLYFVIGLALLGGGGYAYVKTPNGRYNWDKMLLRLPLLGRVLHLDELARACRSMSLLIHAGLPLTEILPLIIRGSNNKVMAKALAAVEREMVQGEGLSRPMSKDSLFPPMMVRLVKVGEETGNLDSTLLTVAKNYETEGQERVRNLIAMIQPAMTIFTGLVVGFIALALASSMYSIYGSL